MKGIGKVGKALCVLACAAFAAGFAACGSENGDSQGGGYTLKIETVYALAEEAGYTGTLEELVELFKGDDGVGIQGVTLTEEGELIVSLTDGKEYSLGTVRGGTDRTAKTARESLPFSPPNPIARDMRRLPFPSRTGTNIPIT